MLKESKVRVLENFYALDYVFFGKPATKMDLCCPALIEEYINIKGALQSVVVEMYKLIDHTPPQLTETVDSSMLLTNARNSARLARENSQKLVSTEQGRTDIKAELRQHIVNEDSYSDIDELVQTKIREKAFSLAVDNLIVARTLSECDENQIKKFSEWEGRLVEDAYKILRDNLVESAIDILSTYELSE